jgi:chemotaxis protein MotB
MSKDDDTGIVVRPAGGAKRSAAHPKVTASGSRVVTAALGLIVAAGVGAGGTYLAMRDRLATVAAHSQDQAAATTKTLDEELTRAKTQATAATAELQVTKAHLDKAQGDLAAERANAEKVIADKAGEAQALQTKLSSALAGQGEVSESGGAVRLELVDKVLFGVGQSELTEHGKQVLGKLGGALLDVKDKQIWVQGHTDDLPITPDKGVKPTFPSNWELASARALTVVHYLQDVSKIEPQRLAAVAFGQYRPTSRTRAKNRRIEIVLYPKLDIRPR